MTSSAALRRLLPSLYHLHTYIRARQIDERIAAENKYYEEQSRGQRDITLIDHQLTQRLNSRPLVLRESRHTIHFLYASRPSNWERHNLPPQLAGIGKLTSYYYGDRGFDDSSKDWLQRRHLMDEDLLKFVRATHERHPVDIFLSYLSGWQTSPATIKAIGDLGIVTCGFHWDDKLSFRGDMAGNRWSGPAALASSYDLNLTNAPSSIIKYQVEGGVAIFWPEAANADHFAPLMLPFEYDVSFVGACYGYRPTLIEYLRRRGISVHTFGPGWPGGSVHESEMVRIYAKSRINLGFGGIGYSMRSQCLKGRDFEVPMSGGLYLTSANPELELVFDTQREIATYSDAESCYKMICDLLQDPERCSKIRRAGRERAVAEHTWAARMARLLDVVSAK